MLNRLQSASQAHADQDRRHQPLDRGQQDQAGAALLQGRRGRLDHPGIHRERQRGHRHAGGDLQGHHGRRRDEPAYLPLYISHHAAVAIHGYPNVPTYPASHGCVRTQTWDQDAL